MKTHEQFKTFYESDLLDELRRIEELRKWFILLSVVFSALILLCPAVVWAKYLYPMGDDSDVWTLLAFCCSVAIAAAWLLLKLIWGLFQNLFKRRVIQKILHFINPSLDYHPRKKISRAAFDQSKLFLQRYNCYKGDDVIVGTIGKTAMKCSELNVFYRDRYSSKTIFKGLFFIADFNKHFKGRTVVLPDTAERLLGRLGKKLQAVNPRREELIQLDNPDFEKEFVVYGSDQVEARYILSPDLMERILDLHRTHNTKIYLAFCHSKVYLAIPLLRDLFEPKKGSQVNETAACEYFRDMQMALGLVENLNLNTRIWSKG